MCVCVGVCNRRGAPITVHTSYTHTACGTHGVWLLISMATATAVAVAIAWVLLWDFMRATATTNGGVAWVPISVNLLLMQVEDMPDVVRVMNITGPNIGALPSDPYAPLYRAWLNTAKAGPCWINLLYSATDMGVVATYDAACVPMEFTFAPGAFAFAGPACTTWSNPDPVVLSLSAIPADFQWVRVSPTLFTGSIVGFDGVISDVIVQLAAGNSWEALSIARSVVFVGEPYDPACEFEFRLVATLSGEFTSVISVSAPHTQGTRCVLALVTGQLKYLVNGATNLDTYVFPDTVLVANP